MVARNFGDFQNLVYAEAVKGKSHPIPLRFQVHSAKGPQSPPRLGVPVRVGGGRGRTDATGEHHGVFTLWNRAPDDGEPARA